jgi:UDP-GlcNAc3NAcA epimerase
MGKIVTVVGARPQFIKAAVLSRKIRDNFYSNYFQEIIIHTGQHYDENMSAIFFKEMEIPIPDYNLDIGSGNHGFVTGKMLQGVEELMVQHNPDLVIVYGDTNSTLAGALAASKLHMPVAHIEAGLRSFMLAMPEEQNRRLTDHLSTWLFAPTPVAIKNLEHEGIKPLQPPDPDIDNKYVTVCGDIMYEAFLYYKEKAYNHGKHILDAIAKPFILLTIHRAENTDNKDKLYAIISALNEFNNITIVFPVHPRTKKIIEKNGINVATHIRLIEPVGYFEMICLENECEFIMTDSGGLQKEAYFADKYCITLRDKTEWTELVDAGYNILVGSNKLKIIDAMQYCFEKKLNAVKNLYGDGNTSDIILKILQ